MLKLSWLLFVLPILGLSLTTEIAQGGVLSKLVGPESASNPSLITEQPQAWDFQAFGTEPFWGVRVSSSGILFGTPDGTQAEFPYGQPRHAVGRPEELVLVFDLGDKNSLTLVRSPCSDGISDKTHTYQAIFVYQNRVFHGCANSSET